MPKIDTFETYREWYQIFADEKIIKLLLYVYACFDHDSYRDDLILSRGFCSRKIINKTPNLFTIMLYRIIDVSR